METQPRIREWFIEVNQGAKCYEELLEKVQQLPCTLYAYIVHDKDVEIITETDPQTGEETTRERVKATHKHVTLSLKNGKTFNAMQGIFGGAHIEPVKYSIKAYQYLLHESPKSKGVKYHYAIEDITTNDIGKFRHIISQTDTEEFIPEKSMLYINEGCTTYYRFFKRFGMEACKKWWREYFNLMQYGREDPEFIRDMETIALESKADEEW